MIEYQSLFFTTSSGLCCSFKGSRLKLQTNNQLIFPNILTIKNIWGNRLENFEKMAEFLNLTLRKFWAVDSGTLQFFPKSDTQKKSGGST